VPCGRKEIFARGNISEFGGVGHLKKRKNMNVCKNLLTMVNGLVWMVKERGENDTRKSDEV